MRILLVEDDLGIASFVVKGLKKAGYVVEHVADGSAGLDELLMQAFDAAIIDIMLPLQDGLIRVSRGVHTYLKQHDVLHIWHVDSNGHDTPEWRNNLYLFAQRIFQ